MILLTLIACLADLRPTEIVPGPQPEREAEGRAQLSLMADAHGGVATWASKGSAESIVSDRWQGVAKLFSPWPDDEVRVHLIQRPGSFDSRARFLEGSLEGWTWGIEDWQTYTIDPQGERDDSAHDDANFMLPTMQYFMDLPFRIQEAEIVRSVGRETVGDTEYDVVFATWGSVEKNKEFDQYLLYLNRDSHRLEKAKYTVRAIAGFVSGTCHLDDQRLVDGLWEPHLLTVTAEPTDDTADGGDHVMTVHALRYDSVARGGWTLEEGVAPIDGI